MRRKTRTVLVGGGGITGLTAALALARAGFRVELFEQAEGFETVGAGLQVSPNALAVLDQLDLAHRVKAVATAPSAIQVMSASSGRQIVAIPLGTHATERYGRPYLVVHRADLQQVLASACADNPDIHLHMESRLDDVATHANGVTALVRQGTAMNEFTGLALVGADGVRSRLRELHFEAGPPIYSGLTAWRALISAELLAGKGSGGGNTESTQLWLAPNAHAITYPVRGGRYLNVVVITRAPLEAQSASDSDGAGEVKAAVRNWAPSFTALLDHKARWTRWPLYKAPRLRRWCDGPVALAGDAAHAMLPFAAQGAAMGIEDAAVLADCLRRAGDTGEEAGTALAQYEQARRTRVARAAQLARTNRLIYHLPPPMSWARDIGMTVLGGKCLLARQDWLYRWTPKKLEDPY
ncbi:MAG: FAD-dependent monooxygenase [Salaquimonas sp.]|nr:FAD-dependent monooxygenase [Salaquimonas sp.]